jgi:hypothetical protein
MFLPKMDNVTYRPKGLGNLAREVVTSYIQVDDVHFHLEKEQTHLDSCRICKVQRNHWPRECGNLQVHHFRSMSPP